VIQRDAAGHATGILLEDALLLVSTVYPDGICRRTSDLMEQGAGLWPENLGLTGIHGFDALTPSKPTDFARAGRLGLRIVKIS